MMAAHRLVSVDASTQVQHPWRATVRTIIQVVAAVAAAVGAHYAGIPVEGAVAVLVGVAGAITKAMANPAVNEALSRFGLGAAPAVKSTDFAGVFGVPPEVPRIIGVAGDDR